MITRRQVVFDVNESSALVSSENTCNHPCLTLPALCRNYLYSRKSPKAPEGSWGQRSVNNDCVTLLPCASLFLPVVVLDDTPDVVYIQQSCYATNKEFSVTIQGVLTCPFRFGFPRPRSIARLESDRGRWHVHAAVFRVSTATRASLMASLIWGAVRYRNRVWYCWGWAKEECNINTCHPTRRYSPVFFPSITTWYLPN